MRREKKHCYLKSVAAFTAWSPESVPWGRRDGGAGSEELIYMLGVKILLTRSDQS